MSKIRYATVRDRKNVEELLTRIDGEFFPPISVQEGSLPNYASKLLETGRIALMEDETIQGVLGYFKTENLSCDLLWISPEKRSTIATYNLLKFVFDQEKPEGRIEAKTWETNTRMIAMLTRLGFILENKIERDYIPQRNSVVFSINANDLYKKFTRRQL